MAPVHLRVKPDHHEFAAASFTSTADRTFEVVANDDAERVDPRSLVTDEWDRTGTAPLEKSVGRDGGD